MKKNTGAVVAFAGTTIAFFIGSGFATGQEILQYFAAYGAQFLLVVLLSMAIFVYTNLSFIRAGERGAMQKPGGIFCYYCGRHIGRFYDVFTTIFVFLSFIVMCGGAGAALSQQFDLPAWVGVYGLAVLVCLTVMFGIKGLVSVLGKIGPVIIVAILFIGIYTVCKDHASIRAGLQAISSGAAPVLRVGNHFAAAAFSYAGFVMLWFCTFMAELGAGHGGAALKRGMCIGSAAIAVALVFMSLSLIANIGAAAQSEIPTMVLAARISPYLALGFSIITICGIFTTGVPLLWTASARYFKEGTKSFRLATVLLSLLGASIAMFLPYKSLVNIVYGINGYVGIALILFMLFQDLRSALRRRASKCAVAHEKGGPQNG